jgi:hypothetical protein
MQQYSTLKQPLDSVCVVLGGKTETKEDLDVDDGA